METKESRFGSLLKIRKNTRDACRRELATVQGDRNQILLALREMSVRIEENSRAWRQAQSSSTPDLQRLERFQARQYRLIEQQGVIEVQLAEAEQRLNEAQERLNDAVREVRILENLRDRQTEQKRTEGKKQEQNRLDALGIQATAVK